jgi:hypothetical protein
MSKTVFGAIVTAALVIVAALFLARDLVLRRGSSIQCADGPRRTIDIRAFEVTYSTYSVAFEAKITDRGELSGKVDPVQLMALSDAAQQAAEFRKLLVAGYNSCAITSAQFSTAGARFQVLDGLAREIDGLSQRPVLSETERTRLATLAQEYVRHASKLAGT